MVLKDEKSDKIKSSRTKYARPTRAMRPPPTKLSPSVKNPVLVRVVAAYMRGIFSTFIAGKSVKVLMARQDRNQSKLRNRCDLKNEIPHVKGQKAPSTNSPVKISR